MPSARASSPARVTAPQAPAALRVRRGVSVLAGVAALVGALHGALELHRFEQRPLSLEGLELPAGDPERFVRALAEQWEATELTLEAGSRVERASRRALGGHADPERVLAEVRAARGSAPIWARVGAWVVGAESAFRFTRAVRVEETRAFAEGLRERVDLRPTSARRDGTGGRHGVAVNVMQAAATLGEAVVEDRLVVRVPVSLLEPLVRGRSLGLFSRFSHQVSFHETRYTAAGDQFGRANNIELAARQLDHRALEPGEELSFNAVVGERSFDRGFLPAVELTGEGRRTEGIGGGICQVAATLHAAAFFGGLDIVEHHPHTRFSRYIDHGLDAAVSWPHRDLRIRNTHPFPVRLRVTAFAGRLRVALMGAETGPRVEWSTRVLTQVSRITQRASDSEAPTVGAVVDEVLDEGVDGAVIERVRTVHWEDGPVTEVRHLRYPVVHRLVRSRADSGDEDTDEGAEEELE